MTSCHRATTDMCGILILVVISSFVSHTDAALSVSVSPSFVARYPTQTVTFSCTVSDNQYTVTSVRWYFSNTLILSDGSAISSYVGRASGGTTNSPSLTLTNLVMSDAGSYICSASNSNGENKNSSHSTLGMQNGVTPSNVQIANVVGNTISLIAGDSIILNCSASGSPTPTITFWRNGVKIWDGSPYTLTNVQSGQAGQYMCIASNFFGQSNNTVQVDVYVKPSTVSLSVSSTNVNVNQPVTFSCFANGIPSQSYRWYKGNSLISGQTSSTYQITSAQGTDSGSYQCQAYNLAGSTTSSTVTFTVNTAVAPTSATISSSPSNGQVNEGGTITLTCASDGTTPSYSWTRNGDSTTWNTQSITITNAGPQDTDTYVCQASNTRGSVVKSFSVTVIISPKSVTISPSSSATYSLGNTITLTCSAAGSSPTYSWTHGSRTFQGSVVSIQSAQRTDSGTYVCQASNAAGSSTSSVTVTVYYAPQVVSISPTSLAINSGDQIQLSCSADGLPTPTYKWFKGLSTWDVQTLTIASSTGSDSGVYACQASNSEGSKNATVTVSVSATDIATGSAISSHVVPNSIRRYQSPADVNTVAVAPSTITINPASLTVKEGERINITCNADGSPSQNFTWTKGGNSWSGPVLFITSASLSDGGVYVCEASNSGGSVRANMTITVTKSPTSMTISPQSLDVNQGDTILLTCNANGIPPPTYTWTKGNNSWSGSQLNIASASYSDTGECNCQASNSAGSLNIKASVKVIIAPTSVNVTPVSLTVSAGQPFQLTCNGNGLPSDGQSYKWTFGNRVWTGQILTIQSASTMDSGIFICEVWNSAGTSTSIGSVAVNTGPGTITFSQSSPLTVLKGNQLSITCSASGNPLPTYSWSKGGTTIFNGGTLLLSNAAKTDSGVYTCTGTNSEGTNSGQFTVNVQYAPEMTTTSNSVSATDGETISLTCNNDANPEATTFEWSCQGSTSNTTKTLSVSVSGTDDFTCSCKAFNSIGASGSQTFSVTVSASGGTGNLGAATGDGGLTTGEIAAICLAVLFVVLLIIIIIVCCCLYGICAGVCGKKEKHKVEPEAEKEKEVIRHVEIPRFHEKPKPRVPSAVTRKDVNLTVNQDNMMYEQEEEFEINTKYAIVPPGSHRSVNGTIITLQDQPAPRDHRLPALDLTYDEEERRRKRRRRKKKKHHSHREPAEGMETPHEPRESSRSRRSHRSHRSSHRYSGELMDSDNYHSRYEDGDLVVIPGPDGYDQ